MGAEDAETPGSCIFNNSVLWAGEFEGTGGGALCGIFFVPSAQVYYFDLRRAYILFTHDKNRYFLLQKQFL